MNIFTEHMGFSGETVLFCEILITFYIVTSKLSQLLIMDFKVEFSESKHVY